MSRDLVTDDIDPVLPETVFRQRTFKAILADEMLKNVAYGCE